MVEDMGLKLGGQHAKSHSLPNSYAALAYCLHLCEPQCPPSVKCRIIVPVLVAEASVCS